MLRGHFWHNFLPRRTPPELVETILKGVESRVGKRDSDEEPRITRRKPATTSEGRETQLVSLAMDLAEQRLRQGTASAQEVTHFLKLGSSRERLEQARIAHENELMQVKIEAFAQQQKIEELYTEAIKAMRTYSGQDPLERDDGYD